MAKKVKKFPDVAGTRQRTLLRTAMLHRTASLIEAIESGEVAGLEKESDGALRIASALRERTLQTDGKKTDFDVLADFLHADDEHARAAASACIKYQAQRIGASLRLGPKGKFYCDSETPTTFFSILGDRNKSLQVRRDLLRALPILGFGNEIDALPVVRELLEKSLPPDVHDAAINALEWCGPDLASAAIGELCGLFESCDLDIRLRVCKTLAWLGVDAKPAMRKLIERACTDEDAHVRSEAAKALISVEPTDGELEKELNEAQRVALANVLRNNGECGRTLRHRLVSIKTKAISSGRYNWMTTAEIASRCGKSKRTAQRWLGDKNEQKTKLPFLDQRTELDRKEYLVDMEVLERLEQPTKAKKGHEFDA